MADPVVVPPIEAGSPLIEEPVKRRRTRGASPSRRKKRGAAGPAAKAKRTRKKQPRARGKVAKRSVSKTARGRNRKSAPSSLAERSPVEANAANPASGAREDRNAYEAGYERGLYEGGEQLLEQLVPPGVLVAEIHLRDVLAAGLAASAPRMFPLADVGVVYEELTHAIETKQPYALVRLGDGELLTLAQDTLYDAETIRREGRFLPYAGVNAPDLAARDLVAAAIRQVNRVGVPLSRRKHFLPLLHPVLRHHGIDPDSMRLTSSTINYELQQSGLLTHLLSGKRLLLIGDMAPSLAETLVAWGFAVCGVISPVNGFASIDRVMQEASLIDFDLALVSAGVPAVVICWRLAAEFGRVALDFGHLADALVKGQLSV
ncbi:GT-D fold domain-containing glycosyltransferase [Paenibacillus aurantiacus]|uniref:GT-D fold domain-containing glycosyltransferase n=1 Tax=Paenibacillus aurantiacus TaxID=1936118 RepID=A0ABV5KYD1_9BACL